MAPQSGSFPEAICVVDAPAMDIRVLGPLELTCGDRSAVPTAPKPRSVLSLLLLHANQTVPVPDLVNELWGDEPPASAMTTLQTYVLHLRKLFSTALSVPGSVVATSILLTVPGGYQFRGETAEFDLRRYQQLAADGRRALAAGQNVAAADLLLQAQQLWRGPVLADVNAGPQLQPQIKRLREARLATMEQGIEARLRLGHHQDMLSELAGLTVQYPLHENLHAQFMVALHRSGRRQEALGTFQQLRTTMIEQLGLEPCKRLHLLQQAVLADDPTLEVSPRDDGLAQLLDQLTVRP
jgi:DNA-binding SARP family transcriptional activator